MVGEAEATTAAATAEAGEASEEAGEEEASVVGEVAAAAVTPT